MDSSLPIADRPIIVAEERITVRTVTVIMAVVVGLVFLFGFGNVWTLALRLGVPPWVAPLVAPAVDLSVVGLLLGTRFLALHGARPEELRPARRLLVVSSLMTLALNVTEPLLADQVGKAAFDAVGPVLLIGWAEVGPGLLQAISGLRDGAIHKRPEQAAGPRLLNIDTPTGGTGTRPAHDSSATAGDDDRQGNEVGEAEDDLLERARREDLRHRQQHQRPISAERLRRQLRVGAAKSRQLVAQVRAYDNGHANGTRLGSRDHPG